MSIPQRIREYLDSQKVPHEWVHHPQAFTSQEVAHSMHVSGKHLAKTVVLHGDGKLLMAVIPASHRLNLQELRGVTEVKQLVMLTESDLAKLFSDCEMGAIPPLGTLYGLDVWMDRVLAQSDEIIFCAGSHADCVRMSYSDYFDLVKPQVGRFSEIWGAKAA